MKTIPLIVVGSLALFGGGCVFQDIRDEVRLSNEHIQDVEGKISSTKDAIDQTNIKLEELETGLARLDTTNGSLKDVQDRLALLRSIQDSLAHVDVHLASLRKTIGRIDHAIPFLDLGTDDAATPAAEPLVADAAPAQAPEATATPTKDEAAIVKRDALVGAWASQYPDRSTALVVLDDGRYVWQVATQGGGWTTESGTWKRNGVQLRLAGEPAAPPAPAVPPTTPHAQAPSDHAFEILSRSARSMTLQAADGRLMIFTKP